MKALFSIGLAGFMLGGCAVVPVARPVAYVAPRPIVVAPAVVAPVVVVRPHGWWWRSW
ncbi:MAG: hypothetical protein JSS46_09285 [Proteobacteria bacterium]|jgi:hypothetical protein|nr:hypothetical protein [Pseudomonadota bacterium]